MRRFLKAIFGLLLIAAIAAAALYWYFPVEYKEDIDYYCEEYALDKHLVYALIKAESNFMPDARSHKDAMGLMQLTQETADWCADRLGEPMLAAQITQPQQNLKLGCFYLSYLLERFDGEVTAALCAYNAGATNVEKWLGDSQYSEDGKSIQITPFPETSGYLKKVLFYERFYKALYR